MLPAIPRISEIDFSLYQTLGKDGVTYLGIPINSEFGAFVTSQEVLPEKAPPNEEIQERANPEVPLGIPHNKRKASVDPLEGSPHNKRQHLNSPSTGELDSRLTPPKTLHILSDKEMPNDIKFEEEVKVPADEQGSNTLLRTLPDIITTLIFTRLEGQKDFAAFASTCKNIYKVSHQIPAYQFTEALQQFVFCRTVFIKKYALKIIEEDTLYVLRQRASGSRDEKCINNFREELAKRYYMMCIEEYTRSVYKKENCDIARPDPLIVKNYLLGAYHSLYRLFDVEYPPYRDGCSTMLSRFLIEFHGKQCVATLSPNDFKSIINNTRGLIKSYEASLHFHCNSVRSLEFLLRLILLEKVSAEGFKKLALCFADPSSPEVAEMTSRMRTPLEEEKTKIESRLEQLLGTPNQNSWPSEILFRMTNPLFSSKEVKEELHSLAQCSFVVQVIRPISYLSGGRLFEVTDRLANINVLIKAEVSMRSSFYAELSEPVTEKNYVERSRALHAIIGDY